MTLLLLFDSESYGNYANSKGLVVGNNYYFIAGDVFLYKMDLQSYNVTSLESFGANSHSLNGVFTIMGNENTLPFIYIEDQLKPTMLLQMVTGILKYNVNTNELPPAKCEWRQ